MKAEDVVEVVQALNDFGIQVWLDGGWGVDALLGEQTRPHGDLDIAIQHKDVWKLRELLEARGYKDVPCGDTWECNFVLGDAEGRLIDVHTFTFHSEDNNGVILDNPHIDVNSETFDREGNKVIGMNYPVDSLTGTGSVNGRAVNCIAAEWMMKFHTGYPLDDGDFHDVFALHKRFGLEMPDGYEKWLTPRDGEA